MLKASDALSDIFQAIGFFFLLLWGLAAHGTVIYNGEDAHAFVVLYGWVPAVPWFALGFGAWRFHVWLALKKGLGRRLYGGGFA